MKTRTLYFTGCLLLALFFMSLNAFGQETDFQVTLFGGGSFLKAERTFVVGGEPFRSNFAKGGKVGVRGGVGFDDHWAVEGAYSYGTNNLRFFDLGRVPPRERAFGVRVHQFTGNVLYYLTKRAEKIRPFVTGGLGLTRYKPTDTAKAFALAFGFVEEPAAISTSNKLAVNFGGGLEAKVDKNFGVRFDFRDHVTKIPRFGVPQAPPVPGADFYPVSGAAHDLEVSAGIVFYFKL